MVLHTTIIKNLQTTPQSLADLHPITGVSLPTLRKAVQELTDSRWIRVVGQAEANGGRPAMLFGLDDSYYALVGVHIQLPGLRFVISDLQGNVLDEKEMFQQTQPPPHEIVQAIVDYTQIMQSRLPDRKLLGIGIAAPGFIDPDTGDIISIGRAQGWENFPICQRLASQLSLPVQIANDVDCMAFAEFQHTGKSLVENLVYIGFDEGVKASMFLNGELYKGTFGNAGLIMDRLLKVPDIDISAKDQHRILTITGFNQIFEEKLNQLPQAEWKNYQYILEKNYRQRMEFIFIKAIQGDRVYVEMQQMLRNVLSIAITNITYLLQPNIIVIGGILSGMPPQQFNSVVTSIRNQLPPLFENGIQIEQAQLRSRNIAALGANYHFLENYLVQVTDPGKISLNLDRK